MNININSRYGVIGQKSVTGWEDSSLKKIILILFVSLIMYVIFFTEKALLDREVNRLCAMDGGIRVYEALKLPREFFIMRLMVFSNDYIGLIENRFFW